jgi:hypothetical protein
MDWHQVSSRQTCAADSDNWGDPKAVEPQRPLTLRHRCGRDMVAASGQIPMAANTVGRLPGTDSNEDPGSRYR